MGIQNQRGGWYFVAGAPVRTGWASPLRVATGGNASHGSKGRRRRSPACADVTARLGCGPIQYHGGAETEPHQIGQREGNQGIAIREFCSDTRLVGLLGMTVSTFSLHRIRPSCPRGSGGSSSAQLDDGKFILFDFLAQKGASAFIAQNSVEPFHEMNLILFGLHFSSFLKGNSFRCVLFLVLLTVLLC